MRRKIDQYFKRGLNVPQEPPAGSWEFIQQRIAKKEKRRILPFWLKISGIAALFLLMIGGGYIIERGFNPAGINQNITKSSQNDSSPDPTGNSYDLHMHEADNPVSAQPAHEQTNPSSLNLGLTETTNASAGFIMPDAKKGINGISVNNSANFLIDGFTSNDNPASGQKNTLNNEAPEIALKIPLWNPLIVENMNTVNSEKEADQEFLLVANADSQTKENPKKVKKKKTDFDRLYILGFASPMAFNTFVGNSMLSDEMSQYKTENNITLAYGIKAGYAISPMVKLRTGISVIGFEQITKDVPLASNIQGRNNLPAIDQLNNVNYNGNLRIDNSLSASLSNSELNNKVGNGNIQQQSSYLEIPLEAEVSLFQTNSIGISATAGGSTWVLSKNKIYVHTDDYTEELGKANNLNNVSFSANAGLKFDLDLSESVKLNLEPNFKYLVNPVNDIKNYNPYTVGVNAGISVSLK